MSPPQVGLRVSVVPVLTHAMALGRIGVLGDARISNDGPAIAGAEVRVTVTCTSRGQQAHALGTVSVAVDLPAHGSVTPAIPPALDPAAMACLREPAAGEVTVEVLVEGEPVATQTGPVQVLGAQQWAATPVTLSLEMLASFVLPQDPALDGLLDAAAQRLASAGPDGAPALDDGPERMDEQVHAVSDIVQARRIRLLDPDSGWPTAPQRIRAPGQVLQDGTATALELALLLAAAIERWELRPLVWITDDGPALGYWREDRTLPAAAVTDVDGVVNLVDLGLIGCLDPAVLAVTDHASEIRPASASGRSRWHGDLSGLLGVVDVASARRDRIDPLPAPVTAADGSVRLVAYSRPAHDATRGAVTTSRAGSSARRAGRQPAADELRARSRRIEPGVATPSPQVPARVAQWKNALLDLSLRNRLLHYTGRGAVSLAVPPGLLAALEDTVNGGGAISLLPSDQVSDVQARRGIRYGRELTEEQRADLLSAKHAAYTDIPTERYPAQMRSLAYRARTIAEETGANYLYLALGTLVWSLDGRDLRSPVVLVPVTLVARSRHGGYRIELDEAGTSTPNYCLLEKLRQVHGVQVPGLAEPEEDRSGIDLDAAFRALRSALAAAGLNHRVEQTADLALLAFAKFRLWKDLDEHWSDLARNPLVAHLISSPTTLFADPVAAPEEHADLDLLAGTVPIVADASQLDAIAAAAAGRTFVLEGPPGTGKSQTITNLLARSIASGRRVLFVAEKRAALDVVTRRLAAVGLAPFCLDLHDKGAKPSVVRAQIRDSLQWHVAADEQGLAVTAEQLRSATSQLARYAERLHEPNAAGLSYYSAHTRALAVGDGPVLPVPHGAVTAPDLDLAAVRAALATLPDVADPAHPQPAHPWGFVDPADPATIDPAGLAAAALAADEALAALDRAAPAPDIAAALDAARTPTDVRTVARFASGYAVDLALLDEAATDRWRRAAQAARAEVAAFASAMHPGMDCVTPEVFALPVDGIDAAARAAAASSWFGRKKRQLAVLARLQPVLRPSVSIARKQLASLTGQLAGVWTQIVQLRLRVEEVRGLTLPDAWNPLTPDGLRVVDERIDWLVWASDAAALYDGAGNRLQRPGAFRQAARHLLESRVTAGLDGREALRGLATAFTDVADACGGDRPFAAWSGAGVLATWRRTSTGRRVDQAGQPVLRRYLALLAHLQPVRAAGLEQARSLLLSGAIAAVDAARAFDAGLAAASLDERAAATGLDGFEARAHDRAVRHFASASDSVRAQLVTAIPAGVVASRSFDAASGFGRIGELSRELAKQRRGLAVRPLLARYGELVTAVMPCTLVSPDSLARFFPPQPDLFDLVVFDEASQIRVADAIGALGRATSAVVVGDSQQMPPTSVAESVAEPLRASRAGTNWGGADSASAGWVGASAEGAVDDLLSVPDEESILSECVQAGVPRRWLSWHYRSQDEALIAFSNRRYYQDRLSTFPSPLHGPADRGLHGHGISLIRVDGRFLRSNAGNLLRTNPIEADVVVAEIWRRFQVAPDAVPSIGVVTFNAPQRTLIETRLRDLDDERVGAALDRTDGEGLFVKNLENVQGDERDVILFSTAFSVNARGVLPLNFGPLNQIGGERRLNVAITRARRQVLVFTSFDPEELRAEETSSQGVRDLRAYLELARSGASTVIGSSPRAPAPDRHRDEVAAALRARGLSVSTNVGLSDFTLDLALGPGSGDGGSGASAVDGGAPDVAVLLDGPEWAARRTVGDRDGLPVEVLSRLMKWPAVERIWLPEWLHDPGAVLDRLEAAARERPIETARGTGDPVGPPAEHPVRAAAADPRSRSTVAPSDPAPQVSTDLLPGESAFTPWMSGYLGSRDVLDRLPNDRAAERVARALHEAIKAEGPVHVDRLAKLVAGGFDLARVSDDRRASILECVSAAVFRDPDDPQFAWPDDVDPGTWTAFRRTGQHTDRPLAQICTREIGNAMVAICIAGAGVSRDQLEWETLHVFGFHRRTTAQLALLDAAVRRALAEGRLRRDRDLFTAGEPG